MRTRIDKGSRRRDRESVRRQEGREGEAAAEGLRQSHECRSDRDPGDHRRGPEMDDQIHVVGEDDRIVDGEPEAPPDLRGVIDPGLARVWIEAMGARLRHAAGPPTG